MLEIYFHFAYFDVKKIIAKPVFLSISVGYAPIIGMYRIKTRGIEGER